jgi:putative membrane protein
MYRGDWNDHMGYGRGIFMLVICVALIGLIVWLVVSSTRRHHAQLQHVGPIAPTALAPTKPTAQQILDERLARGEIEVDDYRARLDALRAASEPSTS